jgi:hypothetical protein
MSKNLYDMSVNDICDALHIAIDFISNDFKQIYVANLREKNINGQVLSICDLNELKNELKMAFGDWELFKSWILNKRMSQSNSGMRVKSSQENTIANSRQFYHQMMHSNNAQGFHKNSNNLLAKDNNIQNNQTRLESIFSQPTSPNRNPLIKIENVDTNQTSIIDTNIQHLKSNENSNNSLKNTSSQTTPTISPTKSITTTTSHGRKVEFFITPVKGDNPPVAKLNDLPTETKTQTVIKSSLHKSPNNEVQSPILSSPNHAIKKKDSTQLTLLSLDLNDIDQMRSTNNEIETEHRQRETTNLRKNEESCSSSAGFAEDKNETIPLVSFNGQGRFK